MIIIWANGLSSSWKQILFVELPKVEGATPEAVSDILNITRRNKAGYVIGTAKDINFVKGRASPLYDHINVWGLFSALKKVHGGSRGQVRLLKKHPAIVASLLKQCYKELDPNERGYKDRAEDTIVAANIFVDLFKYDPLDRK